jgi:PEP-CTERM motif-containing protein
VPLDPNLYELTPNTVYDISVFADAQTNDGANGQFGNSTQAANAFVDPHIFLDVGAGNPYTLELSPDVNNDAPGVGAVPEPSTWAMMGIGFAVLALFYRRRVAGTRLGFAA